MKKSWQISFEDHFDASKFTLSPRDGSFYPYSDVKTDDIIFSENRLLAFNDILEDAHQSQRQEEIKMRDSTDFSSEDWFTKFFFIDTLIVQIIREERIDTQYKIFYDLTGSQGHIPLQLSLAYKFKTLISLEMNEDDVNSGKLILESASKKKSEDGTQKENTDIFRTRPSQWDIRLCSFLEADWIDCNLGIFDCTKFDDYDEGLLCKALEARVRMLQPGSIILVFSKWLICEPFTWNIKLITTDERNMGDGAVLKAWVYKTIRQSSDHRTQYIDDEDITMNPEKMSPSFF
mmetsp:Transcript_21110/g.27384  ORF Transcript_21110/g.27384 Transcript_21110/m.27384 type:complete len:290 (-) Transcript_21110:36-905(-)